MPKTKSRDGKFIISVPDEATIASYSWSKGYVISTPNKGTIVLSSYDQFRKDMYDQETDVYLEAVEGQEITLANVAEAICKDCIYESGGSLGLLTKRLKVHVTVGENSYDFNFAKPKNYEQCLIRIASQLKL